MKTPPDDFIRANTAISTPPHVSEIRLHLADEAHDLWHRTEEELETLGLPPPFWAFAWAGGQGLARYLLDNPGEVTGRTALDFATGSGLVAIAAARCGATQVIAADIDPWAAVAVRLNGELNGADIAVNATDLIDSDGGWDVILAGDVFYDRAMAERLTPWFGALAARGANVLVGDPGRHYLPRDRLVKLAIYKVPVSRVLEDSEIKKTTVWRFVP